MSAQDSHGLYSSHQGMAYSGVAVNLVACTHQAMAAITYLVAVMLAEALLTHLHCILVVAWAAVVIWVVEALDPTIEVHRSVQILRDKKELADTQKELSKLHLAQKDSSASHNSQQNEERSLTPYAKNNDSSADSTGQNLYAKWEDVCLKKPPLTTTTKMTQRAHISLYTQVQFAFVAGITIMILLIPATY